MEYSKSTFTLGDGTITFNDYALPVFDKDTTVQLEIKDNTKKLKKKTDKKVTRQRLMYLDLTLTVTCVWSKELYDRFIGTSQGYKESGTLIITFSGETLTVDDIEVSFETFMNFTASGKSGVKLTFVNISKFPDVVLSITKWLLYNGIWDDLGIWKDEEFWED